LSIGLALVGAAVSLADASNIDMPKLQRQLDYMVAICGADDVVRFVAHDSHLVSIEMVKAGQLPTVSQNNAFQCALAKLKVRPDLHLGFIGNEAAPEAPKR
jgi:hypothetical protein